jgi:hypothetical protein
MKKILILLYILFSSSIIKAQDRNNEIQYEFENNSELITNIIGWRFNKSEGVWVHNQNFISLKSNSYLKDKRFGKSANSIQIKTYLYNKEIRYVLIISFNGGHYTYPEIHHDWVDYIEYMVFSLTKEQLDIILNPEDYTSFTLPCITYYNYWEKRSENWIIRSVIESNKSLYRTKTLTIKRWKDVIRFCYFDYKSDFDDLLMKSEYFEVSINEWNKLKII